MGHGPVVGHGAVISEPQRLAKKQLRNSLILLLASVFYLVEFSRII